jgi:hypothetical protein
LTVRYYARWHLKSAPTLARALRFKFRLVKALELKIKPQLSRKYTPVLTATMVVSITLLVKGRDNYICIEFA